MTRAGERRSSRPHVIQVHERPAVGQPGDRAPREPATRAVARRAPGRSARPPLRSRAEAGPRMTGEARGRAASVNATGRPLAMTAASQPSATSRWLSAGHRRSGARQDASVGGARIGGGRAGRPRLVVCGTWTSPRATIRPRAASPTIRPPNRRSLQPTLPSLPSQWAMRRCEAGTPSRQRRQRTGPRPSRQLHSWRSTSRDGGAWRPCRRVWQCSSAPRWSLGSCSGWPATPFDRSSSACCSCTCSIRRCAGLPGPASRGCWRSCSSTWSRSSRSWSSST